MKKLAEYLKPQERILMLHIQIKQHCNSWQKHAKFQLAQPKEASIRIENKYEFQRQQCTDEFHHIQNFFVQLKTPSFR